MTSTPITGSAFPYTDRGAAPAARLGAWLLSQDPAHFAARHLVLAGIFAICAMAAALPLRLELLTPALDLLGPRTFGALLSLHGTLMFYFVALPVFPGVLGYALLPDALGVRTLVFPRLMAMSWCLLAAGGATVLAGFVAGGSEVGWTFDAEFGGRFSAVGILPMAVGVFMAAAALVAMSVNLVATIVQARRVQASGRAMRPEVSALLLASASALIAAPALACCALVVAIDHLGWTSLFDPASGGDPLLFKTLFRFFVSPAKSAVLVAALGTVFAVVSARTAGGGGDRMTNRTLGLLAVAGLGAWGATETSASTGAAAQDLSFALCAVAVTAAGSVVIRTVAGLGRGITRIDAPMVYAFGFLAMAVPVLGCALALAIPATRVLLGNTTFATAQLHLLMMAALAMAFLAGLHEAWPRLSGRRFADRLGCGAAVAMVIGTVLSFGPQLLLGLRGASFRANEYLPEFQVLQVLSTAGMTVLVAAAIVAGANLLFGRSIDEPAGA
ncbi:MAG: cbb3-type cytochrome c oxidase subunit I [Deltaproteobacteria bacterium]|nr:cbb3-type cytochrome c oxidase subunit I [Deltaproteobacteria bacterium]